MGCTDLPLKLAIRALARFVARAIRLYEQEPGQALASARFGLYVRRWVRWAEAALATSNSSGNRNQRRIVRCQSALLKES